MQEPRLEIHFCTRCRWTARAAWMAQEFLTTFASELGEVALLPGDSGEFRILLNGNQIFDRAEAGRFPETKEIKQIIRDRIAPDRHLGHSDTAERNQ